MKTGIVITIIIVVGILIALYMYNKNNASKISQSTSSTPSAPPCVPFTKAMQDAEKRQKLANCTNKLLIPIVGEVQYAACLANVNSTLTPIVNC